MHYLCLEQCRRFHIDFDNCCICCSSDFVSNQCYMRWFTDSCFDTSLICLEDCFHLIHACVKIHIDSDNEHVDDWWIFMEIWWWIRLSYVFKMVEVTTCSSCHQVCVCWVSWRFSSTSTDNHVVVNFFEMHTHVFIRCEIVDRIFRRLIDEDNHCFRLNEDWNQDCFFQSFNSSFDSFFDQYMDHFCIKNVTYVEEVLRCCFFFHKCKID